MESHQGTVDQDAPDGTWLFKHDVLMTICVCYSLTHQHGTLSGAAMAVKRCLMPRAVAFDSKPDVSLAVKAPGLVHCFHCRRPAVGSGLTLCFAHAASSPSSQRSPGSSARV